MVVASEMKARQSAKIREIGEVLADAGFCTLDQQAQALGLSRSTTWTILRAVHKSSGLTAAIINRILATPRLPPQVRVKINEYIEEKRAGLYGDSKVRLRRFTTRLAATRIADIPGLSEWRNAQRLRSPGRG
jgi:hypothetical protein